MAFAALSPDTTLRLYTSAQSLALRFQDFISEVAGVAERLGSMETAVMSAVRRDPKYCEYFDIEPGHVNESFGLRNEVMLRQPRFDRLEISSDRNVLTLPVGDGSIEPHEIANFFRLCRSARSQRKLLRNFEGPVHRDLFEVLWRNGNLRKSVQPDAQQARFGPPGVYRLQHASLLFRTGQAGIIVDPHFHSNYGSANEPLLDLPAIEPFFDAILISHSHEDHWYPSGLMMCDPATPIVVPRVPRATLLCPDMAGHLSELGSQISISAEWNAEPLRVGDIEVHAVPFYGEQPLRYEQPKDAALRNWGNTYVVVTPWYKCWFLIDSGEDALGSMVESAEAIRRKFGKIDIVLSNLRSFTVCSPLYINGGLNWLSLSAAQMLKFSEMRNDSLTLGARKVAEICKIVDATTYLPYAHWWGKLGGEGEVGASSDDAAGSEEMMLLDDLRRDIRSVGCSTRIVPWKIGDGWRFDSRAPGQCVTYGGGPRVF